MTKQRFSLTVNKNKMMKERPVWHNVRKKTSKVPDNNLLGPARLKQEADFGYFSIRKKRLLHWEFREEK